MIKVKAKKKTDKPGFCVVGGADYSTGIYINKYECIEILISICPFWELSFRLQIKHQETLKL